MHASRRPLVLVHREGTSLVFIIGDDFFPAGDPYFTELVDNLPGRIPDPRPPTIHLPIIAVAVGEDLMNLAEEHTLDLLGELSEWSRYPSVQTLVCIDGPISTPALYIYRGEKHVTFFISDELIERRDSNLDGWDDLATEVRGVARAVNCANVIRVWISKRDPYAVQADVLEFLRRHFGWDDIPVHMLGVEPHD